MKKIFSILFLIYIISIPAIAEKRVAIATFDVVGNAVSSDEAQIITELYITEFIRIGWIVMPNSTAKLSNMLNELKFQASDWFEASKTEKLGNAMNVDVISTGKIMKLGSKLYIIATLIEAQTAKVLSSSKLEAKTVGDIPDILIKLVTSLTRSNVPQRIMKGEYSEGDIGPGGGIIFFMEVNRGIEVSERLGITKSQDEAMEMCIQYRGGGYTDWYLPLADELYLVYMNLVGNDIIQDADTYWTSTYRPESSFLWVMDFSDGERQYVRYRDGPYSIRAVRAFYISDF